MERRVQQDKVGASRGKGAHRVVLDSRDVCGQAVGPGGGLRGGHRGSGPVRGNDLGLRSAGERTLLPGSRCRSPGPRPCRANGISGRNVRRKRVPMSRRVPAKTAPWAQMSRSRSALCSVTGKGGVPSAGNRFEARRSRDFCRASCGCTVPKYFSSTAFMPRDMCLTRPPASKTAPAGACRATASEISSSSASVLGSCSSTRSAPASRSGPRGSCANPPERPAPRHCYAVPAPP